MRWICHIYVACLSFVVIEARSLRFVQAIWRHGDRAPKALPYPDDPYDESYWPRGWNQLTNLGMREMKELGTFFRNRYDHFITKNFCPTEVFLQSSDENRALSSAQAFFNGLYPPQNLIEQFEPELVWQPLPVHSSGYNVPDPLLKPTSFYCPTYNELVNDVESQLNKEISARYGNLFMFLAPFINNGCRPTLKQVRKINDLSREISHNLTQPAWVFHRFAEYDNQTTIELVTKIWLQYRVALFQMPELARLRGGYLLGDWLKRAKYIERQLVIAKNKENENSKNKLEDSKKLQLYSSHDGTILSLLSVMNLNPNGRSVPYATSFIMEMYLEDDNRTMTVELYLRRNNILESISIVGCGTPCKLKNFIYLFRDKAIFHEKKLYRVGNFCLLLRSDRLFH